ncbi:tetratricopeptide repeat protein [Sphingobacterium siyangense]|uniref:tetratricopeptide repeat protein n=1 Tax=Sphingobacterium TaxID=28453 RepID=UPI003DA2A172
MMLSFLNIGNVFNKSYDPDQALKYYQRALDLAKELLETRNRANISTNIGNIYAQNALNGEKK